LSLLRTVDAPAASGLSGTSVRDNRIEWAIAGNPSMNRCEQREP
jgi:hypothetical protein